MEYKDYLLKILKGECPFCGINKDYIVEKWKYFSVILARAPYVKDHVLIIPNRHIIRLSEIKPEERKTLIPIIEKWTKKLEKIHKEINILLRDGVANGIAWKSVDHLHFHLVPDCLIYAPTWWLTRKIYSDYQLWKQTKMFKDKMKWK